MVVLLIAALLLGAFVYVYEIRDDAGDGTAGTPVEELYPGVATEDVEWIELSTTDAARIRAERADGGWRIVEPDAHAADAVAFDAIASRLTDLVVGGRVTGDDPPGNFGVGEEAEPIRFAAEGEHHTLRIGRRTPVGSNTYVRADDGGVVWVDTWRTNALRKRFADLRDRRVIDFDHASVDRLVVEWPGGRVVLAKSGSEWRMVEPVAEGADRATVETLLSDLAFLNADGFIDAPISDDELGLDEPALRITLAGGGGLGGGFERVLVFGALQSDGRVVRGPDGTLFLVDAVRLDELPRETTAYRYKTLAEFDVTAARTLRLTFDDVEGGPSIVESELVDGQWRTSPDAVADARIRTLVATLSRLTADTIVAEEMGEQELVVLGLAPPRLRAEVAGPSGEVVADVAFGADQAELGRLARRAGSSIVYRVAASVAERIPADREDFAARFVGDADPADDAYEPWAEDLEPDL